MTAPGSGENPPALVMSQGAQRMLEGGTSQPDSFKCFIMNTTIGPKLRVNLELKYSSRQSVFKIRTVIHQVILLPFTMHDLVVLEIFEAFPFGDTEAGD